MQQGKSDVLVVGELNVDLILNEIDGFPEIGKEKLANSLTNTLGSSSAIFASNLSSLGPQVSFLGKIGEDSFGQKVLRSLDQMNVDTNFVIQDPKLTTGVTVALNYDNERAMITHQGAMKHLEIDDITDTHLKEAKHLHFSSFFLQPNIAKDLHILMERAKNMGLTTSFDPQWDPSEKWEIQLDKILPHVDVFLPNEAELKSLAGLTDWKSALKEISEMANVVVAKLGANGSAFCKDGEVKMVEPFENNHIVDAIGAGDSFNAGFISRFILGDSVEECARFGNLAGALSTTGSGGTEAFSNRERMIKLAMEEFGLNREELAL